MTIKTSVSLGVRFHTCFISVIHFFALSLLLVKIVSVLYRYFCLVSLVHSWDPRYSFHLLSRAVGSVVADVTTQALPLQTLEGFNVLLCRYRRVWFAIEPGTC